jgi:hypothetical protein
MSWVSPAANGENGAKAGAKTRRKRMWFAISNGVQGVKRIFMRTDKGQIPCLERAGRLFYKF